MKIYCIKNSSGKNILEQIDTPTPVPLDDEILIRHEAIGVNFMDYEYFRGSIKSNSENLTPGIEAVGIVEAIGKNVSYVKVGQRVGYATANSGAYAEYRTIKSYYVFPIHDSITSEAAALNMVKGMTAHYLMRRTFFLREGMTILIHGAASNLGKLMIKLADEWKIKVIGSAGSEEKKDLLLKLGVTKAFNYNTDDQENVIREYTKNQNVSVVYDLIGGPLLKHSLKCLVPFGLAVSAGNAMSKSESISPSLLSSKSLFLTSPRIHQYKKEKPELMLSIMEVFGFIQGGIFPQKADKIYNFDEIPNAMKDIASKDSKSKVILL